VRDLHKALLVAALSASLVMASLAVAYLRQGPRLTSGDLQRIARQALHGSVEAAIQLGGLGDAVEDVELRIELGLERAGFEVEAVEVVRRNDFDPLAAFFFDVEAGGLAARVSVEGVTDPLLAMRLGESRLIQREPADPYETHGNDEVLNECLARGYYHWRLGAPDVFARMENRTGDPYHYGLETFLGGDASLTLDHQYLMTGVEGLSEEDSRRYGLA
jgi:hypothetical protein